MIKDYYSLTKSGLVYGNVITVIGGFIVGSTAVAAGGGAALLNDPSASGINLWILLATIVGIALVMAAGCVFNNIIDRDIDAKMERTKDRALVRGRVSVAGAKIFGVYLAVIGFAVLLFFTNWLAVAVAAFGFFAYISLYTIRTKRRSPWGTVVGSIAGATPPVVGYCAASGRFDAGAFILFLILALWQMPHFFAIAIRRYDDYRAAGIPVLPVESGVHTTKIAMAIYIVAFTVAAVVLAAFGYAGSIYLVVALGLGIIWFLLCMKGFQTSGFHSDSAWARRMFLFSLVVLVMLFLVMSINA